MLLLEESDTMRPSWASLWRLKLGTVLVQRKNITPLFVKESAVLGIVLDESWKGAEVTSKLELNCMRADFKKNVPWQFLFMFTITSVEKYGQ